jgi:hypothetical protein
VVAARALAGFSVQGPTERLDREVSGAPQPSIEDRSLPYLRDDNIEVNIGIDHSVLSLLIDKLVRQGGQRRDSGPSLDRSLRGGPFATRRPARRSCW